MARSYDSSKEEIWALKVILKINFSGFMKMLTVSLPELPRPAFLFGLLLGWLKGQLAYGLGELGNMGL
jgi:hypothetical protein